MAKQRKAAGRKRRGRGEGGCHFDENRGLWVASVSLGFGADGKRIRPVAYGKTKKDALDALDVMRRDAEKTPATEASKMTVSELLNLWLEVKRGHVSDHTDEGRTTASVRVRAALGDAVAKSLTPLRVTQWHAEMAREGVAPSTRWHAARALLGCLSHAVALQILTVNPAAPAGLPGMQPKEMVVLSPAQTQVLLAAAKDHVAYPLIAVALGTGMRQGEQLGLTWDDVNLDAATVSIKRALTRTKTSGFALKKTKTKAARRTLCLPAFVVDALRDLLASRVWQPTWTVFCGPYGSHRHRSQLTTHLKRTIRRANATGAGIPETFSWHSQRHSHASLLLSAGCSIKAVSSRLGHSSPAFSLKIYAHLMPGDDARLAEGMQNIVAGNS